MLVADIVKVERLGAKIRNKDRSIRVKFNNQKYVDGLIKNVKGNTVKVGNLLPRAPSAGAFVYLHRRHPASLYKLRQEIRKKYPNIAAKNIWISYTTVNVRYDEKKQPVKLLPSTGLQPLADALQ